MKHGEPTLESKWDELVEDIWKENGLKHLRDAATLFDYEDSFIYDPSKGGYGFQEGYEVTGDQFVFIDKSDHDELANQLLQLPQDEPMQPVLFNPEKPKPCKTLLIVCTIVYRPQIHYATVILFPM